MQFAADLQYLIPPPLVESSKSRGVPISIGVDAGTSMNSGDGYAFRFGIHGDYAVLKSLKIGLQADCNMDFKDTITLDPSVYIKYYIPVRSSVFFPFLKGSVGASFLWYDESLVLATLLGIEAGFSIQLKHFYIEPGVSFGYPYFWSASVGLGCYFGR